MRQKVPHRVHDGNALVAVEDAHVDVQPENQVAPRHVAHFVDQLVVARIGGDELIYPVGEGVRSGGGHVQVLRGGQVVDHLAQVSNLLASLVDVMADVGADLHHGLVHLGLHPLFQYDFSVLDQFRHVRAQVAGDGVDGLELFLNAEGEYAFGHLWSL